MRGAIRASGGAANALEPPLQESHHRVKFPETVAEDAAAADARKAATDESFPLCQRTTTTHSLEVEGEGRGVDERRRSAHAGAFGIVLVCTPTSTAPRRDSCRAPPAAR